MASASLSGFRYFYNCCADARRVGMFRLPGRAFILALLVETLCGAATMSQSQSASPVAAPESFDTASLKLVAPGEGGLTSVSPWGSHQFRAANISFGVEMTSSTPKLQELC